MEYPLKDVENGQLEIVSANFPSIRILSIPLASDPIPEKGFGPISTQNARAFIRLMATLFVVRICVPASDDFPSSCIASED